MRRAVATVLMVTLLVLASTAAFAEYDRGATVDVMRQNIQNMRGLRTATGTKNYLAVAKAFAGLAQGSRALLQIDPPKGSKADWDRIHNALVDAALEGIVAAAAEDKDAIDAAQGKIGALNKEGHAVFR